MMVGKVKESTGEGIIDLIALTPDEAYALIASLAEQLRHNEANRRVFFRTERGRGTIFVRPEDYR